MRLPRRVRAAALALGAGLGAGVPLEAAHVRYVGSVAGAEAHAWRTAATAKTMDIDGDDVYCSSLGGVHWAIAAIGQQALGSTAFGWGYVSGGGQYNNGGYARIDRIDNPEVDTTAGIRLGSITFELTGSAGDYAGRTVRVGVMQDVLASTEWSADTFKALRIVQTAGGTGDSGIIPVRGGGRGDGVAEMYFFDITGASAGNRFWVQGLYQVGGTSGNSGYVGPIAWDIAPSLPVPNTWTDSFDGAAFDLRWSRDEPNPAAGAASPDPGNGCARFDTYAAADMWTARAGAPILWTPAPAGHFHVETHVIMDAAQGGAVAGVTLYGEAGTRPEFTFGLDHWDPANRMVKFQGLGDNDPLASAAATGGEVWLRLHVFRNGGAGGLDRYIAMYKPDAAAVWTRLIAFDADIPSANVGLVLKANAGGKTASFSYVAMGAPASGTVVMVR